MRPLVAVLAAALVSFSGRGDAAPAAPSQIRIVHADEFTYDGRRHHLLYAGSVKIERGTMRLECDRLELHLSDDEKRIRQGTATGNVEVRDGARAAWARRADFDEAAGTVVLTGAPRLRDGPNELEADTVVYRFEDRRMRAVGNVRGVFRTAERDT